MDAESVSEIEKGKDYLPVVMPVVMLVVKAVCCLSDLGVSDVRVDDALEGPGVLGRLVAEILVDLAGFDGDFAAHGILGLEQARVERRHVEDRHGSGSSRREGSGRKAGCRCSGRRGVAQAPNRGYGGEVGAGEAQRHLLRDAEAP